MAQRGNCWGALGFILAALACAAGAETIGAVQAAAPSPAKKPGWKLLWADEFAGASLNRNKWDVMVGSGCQYDLDGWGNAERQWYTDLPANLRVQDGKLVMEARYEPNAAAATPPRKPYTSARIRTWGKFAVAPSKQYPTVRIEARMKLPKGMGLWPAFWLLPSGGANAGCSGCGHYGVWAASGEIDIMEAANIMDVMRGTIHFGGQWPNNTYLSTPYSLPNGATFADDYHVFRLDWSATQMRWYVDGQLFKTEVSGQGSRAGWYSLGASPAGDAATAAPLPGNAPFNQQFYIILNLALGSEATEFTKLAGGQGITEEMLQATFAQAGATGPQMLVDYVRVFGYQ